MIVDQRPQMIHVHALLTARDQVRLALKREGHIVSQFKASQINELAKQLLDADRPRLLAEARARIMSSQRLRAEYERAGLEYEAALNKQLAKQQAKASSSV
jgi:hypothetical protein